MATQKPRRPDAPKSTDSRTSARSSGVVANKQTSSGPSAKAAPPKLSALGSSLSDKDAQSRADAAAAQLTEKVNATEAMVAAMPSNPTKAAEYGRANATQPEQGAMVKPASPAVTSSTITEVNISDKTGGAATPGENQTIAPLDSARVDSAGRALTTNQGVNISDNQNSLKAGVRGPTLLEDFVLREKIMHFDHERISERVVHARGSGAHGYFEAYEALTDITRAAPFAEAGKRTPLFVRFSTVAGERGSADAVRDVRGFAVKFYTDEGNWDIVGNNIPVFFIQDAMKFPDLIHAVKPEPHNGMPQAASAHDTFWDFVSLMPESIHMLMWHLSDRALPRSYRMMQGFGVHTFRMINAQGESVLVKFHWNPVLGTHSLDWDEAVKINGADSDFHRRDLWEAIEAGAYPEWELGLQIFTEEQSEQWSFDVLDPTKLIPEELVPVRPVGRMVLNRNPDNFFAETEQVAFGTANIIPGIDFTNDPLLQGRNFSYLDTQLLRLGGPNFHEIPINAPIKQIHNNQRDGLHRQAIPRGRVSYEPNSLGGGCPFQAGMQGYVSFPQPIADDKLRGKPEKFAEHYAQARLFWASQSEAEQNHIVRGYRFELTKVQTQAVRERVVSMLVNVNHDLATRVSDGLGMPLPAPQPVVMELSEDPEVMQSPSLSLLARPGDGSIRTRKIAILVGDGMDGAAAKSLYDALNAAGAVPRLVGQRLGAVHPAHGDDLEAEVTLETAPSVLFDAVVLPAGDMAVEMLLQDGQALEFIKDQYRHCKPILALGGSSALLEKVGIPSASAGGNEDAGILTYDPSSNFADAFIKAVAQHRFFQRQMEPPMV